MDNDDTPEGWTESEYKEFKVDDGSDSDSYSDSDSDYERDDMKGYQKKEYKKILVVEDLLPE